jgi:hypothetical protein
MIAGRYRVGDPLAEDVPGASTFAAADVILDRPVRVRVLPPDRPGALDAARRAALVTDTRLARVLDVGTLANGRGYVVSEHVAGPSLADLLRDGPLSAEQARTVVGESASALEVARRRGVHHLALRPSAVHISRDGRVVVSGLAVDALLLGRVQNDEAASRTDALDLVRLLYAAITGTWPASEQRPESPGLPLAQVDAHGAPVAPQSPTGPVPPDLVRLCVAALGPRDDGPRTAGEVLRSLEPWGEIRVAAPSPVRPGAQDAPIPEVAVPTTVSGMAGAAATSVVSTPGTVPGAGAQVPHQGGRGTFDPTQASARPGTPLPASPLPQPRSAAGAVPLGPAPDPVPEPARAEPRTTYDTERRFDPTRLVLVVVAVLVLVALVLAVASLLSHGSPAPAAIHTSGVSATPTVSASPSSSPSSTPSASPAPSVTASTTALSIASLSTYDPVDPAGEHPELVGRAIDGDPTTAWKTRTYKNASFGGLKPGVGLVVTLPSAEKVSSVTMVTNGIGGTVEIRKVDPANPQGGAVLASGPLNQTTTFTLDPASTQASFVIWISQLPTTPDGSFRLELSELTVG